MTSPSMLQFEFEGQPLRFPIANLDSSISAFTGRQLRKAQTVLTISPADADTAKRLIEASPIADTEGIVWSGHLDMESHTNDGPHSLTITWSETEQLKAEVVEFEGLALRPTRYEERSNEDGSITIAFQAVLTGEETDRLRSLMSTKRSDVQYWPVVRSGVSEEPRNMRLGRVIWQQLDGGSMAHDITLVDETYDSSEEGNAFLALAGEPMVGNLVKHLSALIAQYESLLGELEAARLLGSDALSRIRASAESLGPDRRHLFFEVADLSKW